MTLRLTENKPSRFLKTNQVHFGFITRENMTVYGIKNCDMMKKAFDWLKENKIEYDFHDYKKSGIDKATIQEWLKSFLIEQVINTKGTTWKQLSDEQKSSISNTDEAIELMISKPSMIKRPLVKLEKSYLLGFEVEKWGKLVASL